MDKAFRFYQQQVVPKNTKLERSTTGNTKIHFRVFRVFRGPGIRLRPSGCTADRLWAASSAPWAAGRILLPARRCPPRTCPKGRLRRSPARAFARRSGRLRPSQQTHVGALDYEGVGSRSAALPPLLPPAEDREPHGCAQRHRTNPASSQALGPAGTSAPHSGAEDSSQRSRNPSVGG
jgi:hypothetical protein